MSSERREHPSPGTPSRLALGACVVSLALFATGLGTRPDGAGWDLLYDLVLYNTVHLAAAVACLGSARRTPAERTAWAALAVGLLVTVLGNVVFTLVVARTDGEPQPSAADALYLVAYLPLYVALVGLIRARVRRFHPSMWLDGVIGALGATAVAVAVLLAPALRLTDGDPAAVATGLAYPVADVLLLALLVGLGAVLGVRRDRTLLLAGAGIGATLVGDVVYLDLAVDGGYVEGGPLDLTWLAGTACLAVAAHVSRPGRVPVEPPGRTARVGWRVLAVPVACILASVAVLVAGWRTPIPDLAAWCAAGCILAALVRTALTFREVSSFHEVREQARTDDLTGLPNRRALLESAAEVLAAATPDRPAALLLIDLDGFKEVNDGLGHSAGDELLRQLGPRVRAALRPGDVLARLGGDEFAALLPATGLDDAQARAERVREELLRPYTVDGIRLHVGGSIGVATAPVPAAGVEELLRCADAAMYAAKTSRDGIRLHVPDPHGGSGDRLRTMEELRAALAGDQLEVHLQPQVDLADGAVVGVEALVRWRHPTRGLLAPAAFLPAAEQAGLLRPLADVVLDHSLRAAARWWPAVPVPVSVNLSAADVTDLDLPVKVAAALERAGLPAAALTLELVEDTLVGDPDRGRTVLGDLRRLGVRTSIDDYGTGYSSLARLRHLPADELKLDRSLTLDVATDRRAAAIVRHTVALAHELGLRLVAEGVEDPRTGAALATLGCDTAQGHAVAAPLPAGAFLQWLHDRRRAGTPARR